MKYLLIATFVLFISCGTNNSYDFFGDSKTSTSGDSTTNTESGNVGSSSGAGGGTVGGGGASGAGTVACSQAYLNLDPSSSSVKVQCGGDTGGSWSAVCDSGTVTGYFSCNEEQWSDSVDPCPSNSASNTVTFTLMNCSLIDSVTLES